MITALLTAAIAFVLCVALTPIVRRGAVLVGATDMPDARRVHVRPTPRAGGIAVAFAAAGAFAFMHVWPSTLGGLTIAGGVLLLVVGLIDDVMGLRPATKLLAQVGAAFLAVTDGVRLALLLPTGGLGAIDAVLTVVWIVYVTNALNLTDGLDGLATGIGVAACAWLAALTIRAGDLSAAMPELVLTGALLGFLVYNFNPASIVLGDAGSLVIGYAMAVLPLVGRHGTGLRSWGVFLLVAVPATDTLLAITRRFMSRCLKVWGEGGFFAGLLEGLRNTVAPDRRHIHHRLLDLGFTQRRAVLLLYLAAISTGGLAYLVAASVDWWVDLIALGLGISVIGLVRALGIDELRPARMGLVLPVVQRLARHRWMIVTADIAIPMAAYATALALTGRSFARTGATMSALGLVAAIQLASFVGLGVYRKAWWAAGVGGVGLLVRACGMAVVAGYMALRLLHLPTSGTAALVYYLILLTANTLMRLAGAMLRQAVRVGSPGERALICGTASEGRQAVASLRRQGVHSLDPVGFVELTPHLQGRTLGPLPVVGTLDALGGILRSQQVKHLVIADAHLRGETLQWVRAVCRQTGVQVHRYVERFVPLDGPLAERGRGGMRGWEIATTEGRSGR